MEGNEWLAGNAVGAVHEIFGGLECTERVNLFMWVPRVHSGKIWLNELLLSLKLKLLASHLAYKLLDYISFHWWNHFLKWIEKKNPQWFSLCEENKTNISQEKVILVSTIWEVFIMMGSDKLYSVFLSNNRKSHCALGWTSGQT